MTTADLERAERAPRMPPVLWEDVAMLFTTWAQLVEMLFTKDNAHYQGLNHVQKHIMGIAKNKNFFVPMYVVLVVLDDSVRHFNMAMPFDNF